MMVTGDPSQYNYLLSWHKDSNYKPHSLCSGKPNAGEIAFLYWNGPKWYIRWHYNDVIMGAMAYQITSLSVVYSIVYSGADQRKHHTPRCWSLCGEFTGERWIPRTKGQYRGKCYHAFDDVIMETSYSLPIPNHPNTHSLFPTYTLIHIRYNQDRHQKSWQSMVMELNLVNQYLLRKSKDYVYGIWVYKALGIWKGY